MFRTRREGKTPTDRSRKKTRRGNARKPEGHLSRKKPSALPGVTEVRGRQAIFGTWRRSHHSSSGETGLEVERDSNSRLVHARSIYDTTSVMMKQHCELMVKIWMEVLKLIHSEEEHMFIQHFLGFSHWTRQFLLEKS